MPDRSWYRTRRSKFRRSKFRRSKFPRSIPNYRYSPLPAKLPQQTTSCPSCPDHSMSLRSPHPHLNRCSSSPTHSSTALPVDTVSLSSPCGSSHPSASERSASLAVAARAAHRRVRAAGTLTSFSAASDRRRGEADCLAVADPSVNSNACRISVRSDSKCRRRGHSRSRAALGKRAPMTTS